MHYKVHLDGYNQMDLITGKGPSTRHEVYYFAEGTLGAVRIDDLKYRFIDQPGGWLGGTVHTDWPILETFAWIRTSAPASRVRWPTTTGSRLSSGALCSSSRRLPNSP